MTSTTAGSRPRAGRALALAAAAYVLLTAWYFWPLLREPSAHFSVGRDYFQNSWNLWWTRFAWETGRPFLFCEWLFYPTGTSLAYHTITFGNTLPGLVLQDFLGLTAAHWTLFLSSFVFSGIAAWALAYRLTGSAWGALLAGLVYSFCPYHTVIFTQLNNAQFQWIPLFLLALFLLYREGRWWYGGWAALALALAGYADWYQPVFCVLAGGVLLLVLALRDRRLLDARMWLAALASVAAGALLMLPGALPLLREVATGQVRDVRVPVRYVGEMQLLGARPEGLPTYHFWPVILGWVPCLLALWAAWKARDRELRPWWWLLAVSFLLLQGPYLVVLNRHFPWLPMPMALFSHVPVLSMVRVPHRFLVLVMLALAVLCAFGLRECLAARNERAQAGGGRRAGVRGAALGLLACAVVALEFKPGQRAPIPIEPAAIYGEMAADPDDYAVLELPLDFRDGYGMWLQTLHRKRLVGGYTSYIEPEAVRALETPLVRALLPRAAATDVTYLPKFQEVNLEEVSEAELDAWRLELSRAKGVRVVVFRRGPDFPAPERKGARELPRGQRLAATFVPFGWNPVARQYEAWQRLAAAAEAEELARQSGQARALVERLFGPPTRTEGNAEIWDLRHRR